MPEFRISIVKNGPYIVTGNVPLEEKIITYQQHNYKYINGKTLPQAATYALCRCGHSKTMPFCDGSHTHISFNGTETAVKNNIFDNAIIYEGSDFDLYDVEELCAFARFCHKSTGDVWTLTEESDDPDSRADAIEGACDCPAGRLVIVNKETGVAIEPVYEPSIVIIQDPERQCSGPAWVRGGIPIESEDGSVYEIRNRVTLCRCGGSNNKPFCDSTHVLIGFNDNE